MKKKWKVLGLTIAAVFTLSACGDSSDSDSDSAKEDKTEATSSSVDLEAEESKQVEEANKQLSDDSSYSVGDTAEVGKVKYTLTSEIGRASCRERWEDA